MEKSFIYLEKDQIFVNMKQRHRTIDVTISRCESHIGVPKYSRYKLDDLLNL